MCRYQQGFAMTEGEFLQEIEKMLPPGSIEVLGRLVEEPENTILNQTLGQPDHLALTSAEGAHPLRDGFAEAYLIQRLPGPIIVGLVISGEKAEVGQATQHGEFEGGQLGWAFRMLGKVDEGAGPVCQWDAT